MGTPPGLGALADHSSDIVVRFDRAMRHTYVNAAAEGESGRPRAELLGRTLEELGFSAEQCAFWRRELTRVFQSGEPNAFAFERETTGGRRYYEARMAPERDEGGSVVSAVIVTRDVTDRRTHARLFEAEKAARRRSEPVQPDAS